MHKISITLLFQEITIGEPIRCKDIKNPSIIQTFLLFLQRLSHYYGFTANENRISKGRGAETGGASEQ